MTEDCGLNWSCVDVIQTKEEEREHHLPRQLHCDVSAAVVVLLRQGAVSGGRERHLHHHQQHPTGEQRRRIVVFQTHVT